MAATKLTRADRDVLMLARDCSSKNWEGVYPRGASQHRQFAKLVRMRLLKRIGWGVDADDHSRDVPLFAITNRGGLVLAIGKRGSWSDRRALPWGNSALRRYGE